MDVRAVARHVGWYTVVAAGVSGGVVFLGATYLGIATGMVALVLALGSIVALAGLLGTTDAGIETVSAGAEAGFGGGDPRQYQPDSMPGAGRVALVFYFVGLLVIGVAVVALSL